jgi:hypothetical protein
MGSPPVCLSLSPQSPRAGVSLCLPLENGSHRAAPPPGCQKLAAAPVHEWAVCGAMNADFAALNANSALPFILNRNI